MAARVPDAGGCEAPGQGTPVHRLEFSFRSRLPVVLQNEVSECALACLAMIACWHGHRTTLSELRRRFSAALTGTTLRSLADIAGGLGMGCRSLRLEIEDLGRLQTPAMLHWQLDHFVVLKAVRRRGIVVHDPARGKRRIAWGDVSRCFTGVAVEFYPSRTFERKQAPERLRLGDLWERSKGLGGTLAQIVLLSAILQLAALIAPLVNQLVVDEAIAKNDSGFLEAILVGFGLLLGCQVLIEIMRSSVAVYLGQMLAFRLRSNLLRHLFSLPADFFEKRHLGDLMSRIGAMSGIERLLSSAVVTVLIDGALAATTLAVMLLYSPTLALMVAAAGVLALVARLAAFPYVRRLTEEKVYADAELQTVLLESIRAIRAVKLFGRESQRHEHWQRAFVDAANVGIELQRYGIVAAAGSRLLSGGLDLAVFFVGATQVIGGGMSLGMLFAFQAHRAQFAARSGALIALYFDYRMLSIDLERLADIVHAEAECRPGDVGPFATPLTGRIELVDARFRYADDQPWILDGASLRIAPGDRVALTGASGSGKSTLVKILLGLLPLADGAVLYDSIPLTAAGLRDVRRQIGVVMQDDRLLSGTLAENICFFDDEPDIDRIVSAARQAGIDADIRRMPMGYLSFVGDMGSALSGGQKQRLLLARALYRRPRILILDEGTANLDGASERGVFDALGALRVTQLIVAHRPAAIAACNRIVRVAAGAITEIDAPGRP